MTIRDDPLTIGVMRAGVMRVLAGWVAVVVAVSAVTTCVPGTMRARTTPMRSCTAMHDDHPCVSPAGDAACCVQHAPSLTAAKVDRLRPLQTTSPWLAWIAPAATASLTHPVLPSERPPDLISTLGSPTYIALSTLRV